MSFRGDTGAFEGPHGLYRAFLVCLRGRSRRGFHRVFEGTSEDFGEFQQVSGGFSEQIHGVSEDFKWVSDALQ